MIKRIMLFAGLLALGLAACAPSGQAEPEVEVVVAETAVSATTQQMGGMKPGSMRDRHHATIPTEYASLSNPNPADDDSLARGAEIYETHCATCHGDGGMGDGPAGVALDPAPAPIAHTTQMMGDNYIYWRISEGGMMEPFVSAMPRWQDVLDEQARWDVVDYLRALGNGDVQPGQRMGGAQFDPAIEAAKHAEMVTEGVAQEIITQAEGETFIAVHDHLDLLMAEGMEERSGGMEDMQTLMLTELVEAGSITQAEADMFTAVHDSLMDAGIMQ